jgi:hypothetical protein
MHRLGMLNTGDMTQGLHIDAKKIKTKEGNKE